MSEGPYQPGAVVRPTSSPALFRGRGDRRGFEPLDPGPLAPPDRPPHGTWTAGTFKGPLWTGGPCDRLLVDLSAGGLGDAVRMFPILTALRRLGRPGGEILVITRPGAPGEWVARALHPIPVVPLGTPVTADAVIPPLHMLPALAWRKWPRAPITALAAKLYGLPLAAMAGPCLRLNLPAAERVSDALDQAGWDGSQPVVGLQTGGHAMGTPLNQKLQLEKVPESIGACADQLREAGIFPVLIGGRKVPGARALDLGGCPLELLVAMIHRCDLIVAGDSGPMHLGAAVGTPTLAFFGPTDPMMHVCGASVKVWQPELLSCPVIPCGVGSLLGGPVTDEGTTRVELPCPPEGGCLSRTRAPLAGSVVAAALRAIPKNS